MMTTLSNVTLPITAEKDVVLARQSVRDFACRLGLGTVDQTKIMTATSELARNIVRYAGKGEVTIAYIKVGTRRGVKVVFKDSGPGIPNINKAMQDGFSTSKSLGMGLPGAKRLVNHFEIESKVGHGTKITIIRWGK